MKKVCFSLNVKKIRGREFFKFIGENKLFVMLVIFLLSGVLLGSTLINTSDREVLEGINALFLSSFKHRLSQPVLNMFINSLSSSFMFIILVFFMGLSAWGCVLVPVVPFFRGFSLGLFEGYLCSIYGIKGILYYILILLPGIFISSIAILLIAKEAVHMSHGLSVGLVSERKKASDSRQDLRLYMQRTGCVFIMAVAASLLDVVFYYIFSAFFSFS